MNARAWSICAMLLGLAACAQPTSGVSFARSLDTLTQREPDAVRQRAMRRLQLASAYYEYGQDAIAMQEARAALQIDASYAQAYSLLGLIHQRQNAPALAEQSFQQALQLAHVDSGELGAVQHNYGWFLCERAQFARGQAELTQALTQPGYANTPQTAKTQAVLAHCQQRAAASSVE